MAKTIYQRMLEDRFYLYRPWIPICKSIEAEAVKKLELKEPVLDIGCGNGLFGKFSFNKKIDVGLDCDVAALKEAAGKDIYKRLGAGDAEALPFSGEIFMTVISICALEHIPDLDKVLSEACRVLKKDGQMIFTVPSAQFGDYLFASRLHRLIGFRKKAKSYGDEKNKRSGHLHIYEHKTWEGLLRDKKFRIDSIDYIFPKDAVFMWSFLHSLLFKIVFLPFRIFRDLGVRFIDDCLRFILDKSISGWLAKRSDFCKDGGYLLIRASKNA